MESLTTSYCTKGSHNHLRGSWDITHLTSKFSNLWSRLVQKAVERAGPRTQVPSKRYTIHQNAPHHMAGATGKEKLLNFLEIKAPLRKAPGFSPNPKMQKEVTRQQTKGARFGTQGPAKTWSERDGPGVAPNASISKQKSWLPLVLSP